jgi:hypothetical protein
MQDPGLQSTALRGAASHGPGGPCRGSGGRFHDLAARRSGGCSSTSSVGTGRHPRPQAATGRSCRHDPPRCAPRPAPWRWADGASLARCAPFMGAQGHRTRPRDSTPAAAGVPQEGSPPASALSPGVSRAFERRLASRLASLLVPLAYPCRYARLLAPRESRRLERSRCDANSRGQGTRMFPTGAFRRCILRRRHSAWGSAIYVPREVRALYFAACLKPVAERPPRRTPLGPRTSLLRGLLPHYLRFGPQRDEELRRPDQPLTQQTRPTSTGRQPQLQVLRGPCPWAPSRSLKTKAGRSHPSAVLSGGLAQTG